MQDIFCSLPGSPRRLANLRDVQHLARLQEVSSVWCIYTIHALYRSIWHICNICKYDIYVTYTFCNYLDKENLPGELEAIVKLELHQSRTETCFWRYFFANNFCFWRYLWWFQNACAIFTIPPPLCSGRPISPTFLVLVICMSIASQSINRADTRPHLTTPD